MTRDKEGHFIHKTQYGSNLNVDKLLYKEDMGVGELWGVHADNCT